MDLEAARRFLGVTVSKTRYSARKVRNLKFNIDIDYVMKMLERQQGKCALTGWDLEFTRGGSFGYCTNPRGCTIDRIDSSKGYTRRNVQLTCWMPNKFKAEFSNTQLVEFCKTVVDNCRV
jgi:hypothetical protein